VASPEVGGGQRGDEQLLRLPVIRSSGSNLPPADGGQLSALGLHHLVLRDVLDRLGERCSGAFDCDFALVVDGSPNVDCLPWNYLI